MQVPRTYLSRIRGCFLAGAIGDALGAGIEFDSLASIRTRHGPDGVTGYVPAYGRKAAITDDTQMSLFTAEGLIRASVRGRTKGSCHPPSVVRHAYLRWLNTQGVPWSECALDPGEPPDGWLISNRELFSPRAPGNTCLSALRSGRFGTTRERLNDSKGCGGVMRVAPVGFLRGPDPSEIFSFGVDIAAITHSHPTGYLASGALALAIRALVDGRDLRTAIERAREELRGHDRHQETSKAIEGALALASNGVPRPEDLERLGGGWIAEEALAISLCCALAHEGETDAQTRMRRSLLLAVNHSGDSDSTGAIAGHILGTLLGLEAVPLDLLEGLECRELIDTIARDFAVEMHMEEAPPSSWLDRYPGR